MLRINYTQGKNELTAGPFTAYGTLVNVLIRTKKNTFYIYDAISSKILVYDSASSLTAVKKSVRQHLVENGAPILSGVSNRQGNKI